MQSNGYHNTVYGEEFGEERKVDLSQQSQVNVYTAQAHHTHNILFSQPEHGLVYADLDHEPNTPQTEKVPIEIRTHTLWDIPT